MRLFRTPHRLRQFASGCSVVHDVPHILLPYLRNAYQCTTDQDTDTEPKAHSEQGQTEVERIERAEATRTNKSTNEANRRIQALHSSSHMIGRRGGDKRIHGRLHKCINDTVNSEQYDNE